MPELVWRTPQSGILVTTPRKYCFSSTLLRQIAEKRHPAGSITDAEFRKFGSHTFGDPVRRVNGDLVRGQTSYRVVHSSPAVHKAAILLERMGLIEIISEQEARHALSEPLGAG